MSGITPELISDLVAYANRLGIPERVDDLKEDLLNHAYDALDGKCDEDELEDLWQQLRGRLGAAPVQLQPDRRRAQYGQRASQPEAPLAWTAADGENCTAPYRFTVLNQKVSRLKGAPQALNEFSEGCLDAVIKVDWRVETPILIGKKTDGITKPFKLGDDYALPGATLRGLLRSTVETIAFGRLFQVNRHKRFALRDFHHEAYGDFIKSALAKPGLQAGWLRLTKDGAEITPCDWGFIRIDNLSCDPDWKSQDRAWKYGDQGVVWQGATAFTAAQHYSEIGEHQNRGLYEKATSGQQGYCVFSGMAPGKKFFEYVFFDQPDATPVHLSKSAWQDFQDLNCKPSQNGNEPTGAWKEFHLNGEVKGRVPVFYMGDLDNNATDEKFYFGLTRLFRIPHKYRLGEILLRAGEKHRPAELEDDRLVLKPDFVENLFGYVYEPKELEFGHNASGPDKTYNPPVEIARKGRVAFGFARPSKGSDFELWPQSPIKSILATPKPSFAPFYLAGAEKDYSAAGSRLAGRKRYIVRKTQGDTNAPGKLQQLLAAQNANVQGDVHSSLQFLKPGKNGVFQGEIRLNNVSMAELGCILWALTFGGNSQCRHLIGHAKAFGAGQVQVSGLRVHQKPHGAKATEISWTCEDGRKGVEACLNAFETEISDLLGFDTIADWRGSPEITQLLKIATPRGFDAPNTTYLPFNKNDREFSNLRNKAGLQTSGAPNRLLEP